MMADILPYLGVKRESTEGEHEATMPMAIGKDLPEAEKLIEDAGLRYRTIGNGTIVTKQLPEAGSSIASGTQTILYLDAEISQDRERLPDLSGMSYEQARDTLSYYGLYISSQSPVSDAKNQTVNSQNLPAGAELEHGSIVEVTLVDQDEAFLGRY